MDGCISTIIGPCLGAMYPCLLGLLASPFPSVATWVGRGVDPLLTSFLTLSYLPSPGRHGGALALFSEPHAEQLRKQQETLARQRSSRVEAPSGGGLPANPTPSPGGGTAPGQPGQGAADPTLASRGELEQLGYASCLVGGLLPGSVVA